ncbi:hypothetical protein COO60DRAFT_281889 [Scenedesmus sp. NREL 46B-D3]|nr:hypothetical protein COO60DRAFT_281889 [Scenedesmus sp. NREL 46B-D3]
MESRSVMAVAGWPKSSSFNVSYPVPQFGARQQPDIERNLQPSGSHSSYSLWWGHTPDQALQCTSHQPLQLPLKSSMCPLDSRDNSSASVPAGEAAITTSAADWLPAFIASRVWRWEVCQVAVSAAANTLNNTFAAMARQQVSLQQCALRPAAAGEDRTAGPIKQLAHTIAHATPHAAMLPATVEEAAQVVEGPAAAASPAAAVPAVQGKPAAAQLVVDGDAAAAAVAAVQGSRRSSSASVPAAKADMLTTAAADWLPAFIASHVWRWEVCRVAEGAATSPLNSKFAAMARQQVSLQQCALRPAAVGEDRTARAPPAVASDGAAAAVLVAARHAPAVQQQQAATAAGVVLSRLAQLAQQVAAAAAGLVEGTVRDDPRPGPT